MTHQRSQQSGHDTPIIVSRAYIALPFQINSHQLTMDRFRSSNSALQIPNLTPRIAWDGKGLFHVSPFAVAKQITNAWNKWTDGAEAVLRKINDLTEDLDVTEDEYINFIKLFSTHPPRPEMPDEADFDDQPVQVLIGFPLIPLIGLHRRWETFADKLEEIHHGMARELSRCKIRPGGKQEMMIGDEGDLGLSQMSLSACQTTRTHLKSVLTSMLGPEKSFQSAENGENKRWDFQKEATEQDSKFDDAMRIEQEGQLVLGMDQMTIEEDVTGNEERYSELIRLVKEFNRNMKDPSFGEEEEYSAGYGIGTPHDADQQ